MDVQDIRNLQEAYLEVYAEKEEIEELDEEGIGAKASKVLDKVTKAGQSALERVGVPINRVPRPTARPTTPVKEGVDLFDCVLEHLVAEGYADTNEAALVIMANMSEEWRQSIVETIWYGKSGFNPPVAQQRRLGPEVGASGGFSVLAKKGGVEGMKQLMPPGQGKDKWHPGKWTPEGRKRHEDQKNKSPNLLGRIVNTVYKDK